tara:strand:- start:194 stop:394 length:201 start_codon:yes stop_codon:yes gene_type:complete
MSTLQHDSLFETCNDRWDIVPCFNGVGTWEVIETDSGSVHETFDTLDEARKAREEYVMDTWEGLLQ